MTLRPLTAADRTKYDIVSGYDDSTLIGEPLAVIVYETYNAVSKTRNDCFLLLHGNPRRQIMILHPATGSQWDITCESDKAALELAERVAGRHNVVLTTTAGALERLGFQQSA